MPGLSAPRSLSDVAAEGVDGYAAIFIPGGHAPMIDLMADPELGRILRAAHNQGKITAAICHGPVALAAATQQPAAFQRAMANNELIDAVDLAGAWPYRGYKMTVFSRAEEAQAQQGFGGSPLFNTQTALEVAGANVQEAGAWYPAAIRDRELITGQNPFSDEVFSDLLLKALSEPKA